MDSKWGTNLVENSCERIYKDRRKHYVVVHERNQGKCANTSTETCEFGLKSLKLKILGLPHEEVLITTDPRDKFYNANETTLYLRLAYCSKKI